MGGERNVSEKHGLESIVFGQTLKSFDSSKKYNIIIIIPSERASPEEKNGSDFSSVAPSSKEL